MSFLLRFLVGLAVVVVVALVVWMVLFHFAYAD